MNDFCTCTEDNVDKFVSWLLSIEKVARLTENDPKSILLEGSLFKFLYLLARKKFSWNSFEGLEQSPQQLLLPGTEISS